MTTKDQERKAVEKIRKIVEELGENSYVGFAMEGVLELAEDNIRGSRCHFIREAATASRRSRTGHFLRGNEPRYVRDKLFICASRSH